MNIMGRAHRRLWWIALTALVVAACGQSLPRRLTGTKPAAIDPLTVTVIDNTGFVRQLTFPLLADDLEIVGGLQAVNPDGDLQRCTSGGLAADAHPRSRFGSTHPQIGSA